MYTKALEYIILIALISRRGAAQCHTFILSWPPQRPVRPPNFYIRCILYVIHAQLSRYARISPSAHITQNAHQQATARLNNNPRALLNFNVTFSFFNTYIKSSIF